MAYKSILTIMSGANLDKALLNAAQSVATLADAHLDILCLGIDTTQQNYSYLGTAAAVFPESLGTFKAEAETLADAAQNHMKNAPVRWASEVAVARMPDLGRGVGLRARFADLVVLGKPFGTDNEGHTKPGPDSPAVLEGALFDAGVPVLVVPADHEQSEPPKRIIIGWDESREALHAIRTALPLLKQADMVNIVIIAPPTHGPNRSDPGGQLSQMLVRHGVKVEISVLSKSMPRISDVLMRHAADFSADLIVMGAYSHSRFREALLGGATREMLEKTNVPLLMAH